MALSGVITLPKLSGILMQAMAASGLRVRSGWRVYPFQTGAMVRANSTTGTILTHGLGEFVQNGYVIPCQPTDYGESSLFIPDTGRITKITSNPAIASDDVLVTSPARTISDGEYLLNIGIDGGTDPLTAPDYDGSGIALYLDNVGNTVNPLDYLSVGSGGQYQGWVTSGYEVTDLMFTNAAGTPQVVIPFVSVGREIR